MKLKRDFIKRFYHLTRSGVNKPWQVSANFVFEIEMPARKHGPLKAASKLRYLNISRANLSKISGNFSQFFVLVASHVNGQNLEDLHWFLLSFLLICNLIGPWKWVFGGLQPWATYKNRLEHSIASFVLTSCMKFNSIWPGNGFCSLLNFRFHATLHMRYISETKKVWLRIIEQWSCTKLSVLSTVSMVTKLPQLRVWNWIS